MKNLFKKLTMAVVALSLVLTSIMAAAPKKAEAKNIYFSGEYVYKHSIRISLSQYSSPEGKEVGTFQIDIPHAYNIYNGALIKIGKNKYRSKKKGLTFKVYKKKIVVKGSGKRYGGKSMNGTYKLKRHFYS